MSKKDKDEKNLIFEDFENRVDIKLSPEIDSPYKYDRTNYIMAELLSWLKSFYEHIFNIRTELEIQKLFKYPQKATVKKLVEIVLRLNNDKQEILEKRAREVAQSYHLTEAWWYPIGIAVLTHTLIVPPKESIRVHLPDYFYPQEKTKKKPQTLLELAKNVAKMRLPSEVIKYPAIYFTRQVSINELKNWITEHRRIIRTIQYKLPQKKTIRRKQKTLFWGQFAWILKQDGIHSWAKMEKIAGQMIDRRIDEEKIEPEKDDFMLEYPTVIELEKSYNRFRDSLRAIDSP